MSKADRFEWNKEVSYVSKEPQMLQLAPVFPADKGAPYPRGRAEFEADRHFGTLH
jgi:hypothetical protein